jgi:hypothetical protein
MIAQAVTAEKPAEEAVNPGLEGKACCDTTSKTAMACCDSSTKVVTAEACETEAALAAQPALSDLMMIYNRHTIK